MLGRRRIQYLENELRKRDRMIQKLYEKSWDDLKVRFGMQAMLQNRDLIIELLERTLKDAIVLASGKTPQGSWLGHIEKGFEIEKEALERNNLVPSRVGQVSHRFGRIVYKSDYREDGGAIVWERDGPADGETTILGPVEDDDGMFIDYSSRVAQLEAKKERLEVLRNPDSFIEPDSKS